MACAPGLSARRSANRCIAALMARKIRQNGDPGSEKAFERQNPTTEQPLPTGNGCYLPNLRNQLNHCDDE
jgi:hypothetical protein